ncbi:MAG: IclR family transcriptional regulator [Candidatus Tectomicrobia bacterium]|uniref:IclR family transcriptional regulator n=1 Tax=Tectimicrobiota bacterium TaxID=2528274 RepID=A0A932GMT0_UNCTE|nr:IclR family transcriptional regulator [Candidatus Tectomicrobia bacterium]
MKARQRENEGSRSSRGSGADVLKSLRKAIRVLECFSLQEPRLSLSDIARRAQLPLSTAHRILATLRGAGIVEQEGDRELYRLGLKLFELGSMVLANMEVHREALPFIEELSRESGETVHLGVFDGSQVVSIEKMDSPHGLASQVTIGKGAPAYCTAVGKALLAFQSESTIDHVCRLGLTRHTPQTITDPGKLRKELERIRALGYAVDEREHQPDVRCVAAPIRDHTSNVIASMSVSGPATRIPKERIPLLAVRMKEVAGKLSARLGYTGRHPVNSP